MPQWPTDFFENDNYKIKRRKVESIRKRECKRTLKMPHKKALKHLDFMSDSPITIPIPL